MPVSFLDLTPRIISEIQQLQPASILDVGCGYGTYGHLIRAHVDKYPWTIRLEAVEAFPNYLDRIGNMPYSKVYRYTWEVFYHWIGTKLILEQQKRKPYDLILLIDVIEHFDKEEGLQVIEECKSISRRVLISTPSDPAEQGAEYGNKYEIHKSRWSHEDFHPFGWRPIFHGHAVVGLIE